MRRIFATIAAALRCMPRFVLERVMIAGLWVLKLIATPAEPELAPAVEVEDAQEIRARVSAQLAAVRTTAAHLAAKQLPPRHIVDQLSERDLLWLTALSHKMLCSVVGAGDADLRAHMIGRRSIRGLLICDVDTIKEYKRAIAVQARIDAEGGRSGGGRKMKATLESVTAMDELSYFDSRSGHY